MQFINDHLKISRVMCTKGKLFQLGFQPFKATWCVYVDLLVLISWNLPMTIKISGTRLWRCSTGPHWLEQRCIFHRNPWVLCQGQSQKIPPSQYDKNWLNIIHAQHVIRCCSVAQSCPTLCSPMDRSTPGFPVHHHLLELAQTHVHWVGDAIQPSHPLSPPSPPALNLSQHQGLFQWVDSSHQVA